MPISTIDPSLDYVDDSEPERKRIRLQAGETELQRRRQKQSQRQNTVLVYGSPPSNHVPI